LTWSWTLTATTTWTGTSHVDGQSIFVNIATALSRAESRARGELYSTLINIESLEAQHAALFACRRYGC